MAKVNLTSKEWGDFIAVFLLDAVIHDDVLDINPEFRDLIDELRGKLKPQLLKYYLQLSSDMRANYRRVRKDLIGQTENETNVYVRNIKRSA